MYLELFKLRELPFRLSPDPAFLYLSKHHARAKAYMESTIWFTDGFVVITGEIGSGKTTLIETFLKELDNDTVVVQINQTQVTALEFLRTLLAQLGFQPFKMKKAELLATLNHFLIEQYAAGRRVVLIVDEAQNLSSKVLEEVRMLSGVETTKEKVLRIIFCGQPELNDKLNAPELVQLAQRIRLRFHLTSLSKDDMQSYILHRLEVAGAHGREIFDAECWPLIYRYTGGVPRLINTLCDTAMLAAYALDRNRVTEAEVRAALEELQWAEYAERSMRLPAIKTREPAKGRATSDTAATDRHPILLARISVMSGGRALGEYGLPQGRFIIGRTPDNDLPIDSKYISRHHAQIVSTLNSSVIEDLNSTNGVLIGDKRVRRRVLNDGDVVQIGQHTLTYIDERLSTTRPNVALDEEQFPAMDQTIVNDVAEPLEHAQTSAEDWPKTN